MPRFEKNYPIARMGRATSFTESELPVQFVLEMKNRFINAAGGAEKRQGMSKRGSVVGNGVKITGLHELIKDDGTSLVFASGAGKIFKYDGTDWPQVHSGLDATKIIRSIQFGPKLIFYNAVDHNVATEDGTAFDELRGIIVRGEAANAVSAGGIDDSNVTDWVNLTDTTNNDIVYNVTNTGYGLITSVSTAAVVHTTISSAATGLGQIDSVQKAGDRYSIIDSVELNIIATDETAILDNVGTAGSGTDATTITMTDVNFGDTKIRKGDWVSNTTRSALALVSSVATALTVTSIASQVSGDSLVFLQPAMPITKKAHVHFNRGYYLDERDQTAIRITGIDAPEDLTTDAADLNTNTLSFGNLQPEGDTLQTLGSFQRFLGLGGKQATYLFQGTDPILDTSADSVDFGIIGLFPQGVVSPDGLISIGNDLVFVTPDGVQTTSLIGDASTLNRANISESIKSTLREDLRNTPEAEIIAFHYPRRSWFMLKVGSQINVFNYTAFFSDDQLEQGVFGGKTFGGKEGSWSLFDGKFARQNAYLVLQDSTLICAGDGGNVYTFDDGTYADDGEVYSTDYETGWLTLMEPSKDIKIKQVNYIKPIFEAGTNTSYDVTIEGGFDVESRETITVNASGGSDAIGIATIPFKIGGSGIQNKKYACRSRGEVHKVRFTTTDNGGPETISRFTLYGTTFGAR